MSNVLLASPKITGEIKETAFYNELYFGATRPILLIGHSNADQQNTPYQVTQMKAAINWLKADDSSPLLRGLLEAYNAGCRDIWLYSVAPMSEYISDVGDRNTNKAELGNISFYQKYAQRLAAAYDLLVSYNVFEIIVPIETSLCYTGSVNFLTPLAQLCEDIFTNSSRAVMGVIGTRAPAYNQTTFNDLVANPALTSLGNKGRNIMPVVGEGIMINNQMSRTYGGSYAVQVGALLSTIPLTRSIFGIKFSNVAGLAGYALTEAQIEQLSQAKLNPVLRTKQGNRGKSFETYLTTDNSLAPDGSQYWSINQTRLVATCVNTLKMYSEAYIGTTARDSFKQTVYDYFELLRRTAQIKDYNVVVDFPSRLGQATITASLTPIFGIRNIYFEVNIGVGS